MAHRITKVTLLLLLVVSAYIILKVVSMPPQYYESKFHFRMYASEIDELSEEFNNIPAAQSITLVGSSLIVEGGPGGDYVNSLADSQKERIAQLMTDIAVPRLRRTELGNMFVIGSQSRFGSTYQISFVAYRDLEYLSPPNCAEEVDGDFGVCSFPLRGNWALRFEWSPTVRGESEGL